MKLQANKSYNLLELTEQDIMWLHSLMQNPIGCSPENEDPMAKGARCRFFQALNLVINPPNIHPVCVSVLPPQ